MKYTIRNARDVYAAVNEERKQQDRFDPERIHWVE